MPEIKKALVTAYISEENKAKLRAALAPAEVDFRLFLDKKGIKEGCRDCDVAIFNGDLDEAILDNPNIRWIHCCRAGVEKSVRQEIFDRGIILTSSSGRSAPALAEHALMFMMALTYDLPMLSRAQQAHKWAVSREYAQKTGMYKKTVGIIGLGKTGQALAKLCKAFDMTVLGYRRSPGVPENVDEVFAASQGETIGPILERSDYVVLCIELNDETWGMIGEAQLAAMKKSAFLINMGRGGLVDEQAMIRALQNGTIAGAGLDTFAVEPLPESSPLWDMENVMITPHITPKLPDFEERMLSFVYENIHAYRNGGRFVNRVTEKNILTKRGAKS